MNTEKIRQAAGTFETPFYVFDTDALKDRVKNIKELLAGCADLCFAMKANPFLTNALSDVVDRFEICSPGEYHIYKKYQLPGNKIIYSGVYKDEETLSEALEDYTEEATYTIESEEHLRLIDQWTRDHGRTVNVLLRLTSGNQFGMDEELVCKIVGERESYPGIHIAGIHYFSGTQKHKISKIQKELEKLDQFCLFLKEDFAFEVQQLEYGPGAGISYFPSDKNVLSTEEMVTGIREIIKNMQFQGTITLEMGRFLTAMCGSYFTAVRDIKCNKGENYVITDGGIHQLNYDGQLKGMYLPHLKQISGDTVHKVEPAAGTIPYTICGALCTVNDVICRQAPLLPPQKGDILIFERTGAYSVMEGMSLFLSRELPQVILYGEENGFCVVREHIKTEIYNS